MTGLKFIYLLNISSLIQTLATISSGATDETMKSNYFGMMFSMIEVSLIRSRVNDVAYI
jgi:hypothetical protein